MSTHKPQFPSLPVVDKEGETVLHKLGWGWLGGGQNPGTAMGLSGLLTPAIIKPRLTGPQFAQRVKARGHAARVRVPDRLNTSGTPISPVTEMCLQGQLTPLQRVPLDGPRNLNSIWKACPLALFRPHTHPGP